MVTSRKAKEWAQERLNGVVLDALYTPFCGRDGDEVDYGALRQIVRYVLGDLQHGGLYVCGAVGEFWALTKDERKQIAAAVVDEARKVNPKAVLSIHTTCLPVKDCVELTLHAQEIGADNVVLLTPYFETWGTPGVYEYYKYVASRTDIAVMLYNSPSTGLVLSPKDIAELYNTIPAVCAIKNGIFQPAHSIELHRLVPKMVVWECDLLAAGRGGLMKYGHTAPVYLGGPTYLYETPSKMLFTEHWKLLLQGKLTEATDQYYSSGLFDVINATKKVGMTSPPDRPAYVGHWGSGFKYCASLLGMPVGDYPHSRPPQIPVPESMKQAIRDAYAQVGFIKSKPALASARSVQR